MKNELKKLIELQEIDKIIREMEEEITSFPEKVKKWESDLQKKSAEAEKIKEEHTKNKLLKREKEGELKVVEDEVKKLQKVLNEVKTNKAYNSLLSEIKSFQSKTSEFEENVLVLMEKEDDLTKKDKNLSVLAEEEKRKVEKQKKEEGEKIEGLKKELEQKEEEKKKKISEIDKNIYSLYEKIRKNKKDGIAICELVGEQEEKSCSGCFVFVPTYISERVKKKNETVQCENCGRILC